MASVYRFLGIRAMPVESSPRASGAADARLVDSFRDATIGDARAWATLPPKPNRERLSEYLRCTTLVHVPLGSNLVERMRRCVLGDSQKGCGDSPPLFLTEHPLPLEAPAHTQRGAWTGLIGLASSHAVIFEPPLETPMFSIDSYAPTGVIRVEDRTSADAWRRSGCLDLFAVPYELILEVLPLLGLALTGLIEQDRSKINERLQLDPDAAHALFDGLQWPIVIKHRVQLQRMSRPCAVATIRASMAESMHSEIRSLDIPVAYSRGRVVGRTADLFS